MTTTTIVATDTTDAPVLTDQEKFKSAIQSIRKNGVTFRQNVRRCCRSCMTHTDLGIEEGDKNYGYTYGGQNSAVLWENGVAMEKTYSRIIRPREEIYINFGSVEAAKVIADAMREVGFNVEWDGTQLSCVVLHLNTEADAA